MGRSQETYSKKEKEKKRLKKKQDKLVKKEERKTGSGKSFEDMLAYVDAYGNIVDAPVDNSDVEEINSEDIEIGIPKREDVEPEDVARKGTVTYYNSSKGYGFIKDHVNQESVFVHVNSVLTPIDEGDKVTFETEMGKKGLTAIKVSVY